MRSNIMFIESIDHFVIKGKNIELIGEVHLDFQKKIKKCTKEGYQVITDYLKDKVDEDFLLILELDESFKNTYLDTYSTNLNLLQNFDCNKLYSDIRYGINNNYQIMYDFEVCEINTTDFIDLINMDIGLLYTMFDNSTFDTHKDKIFIKKLIDDIEDCISILKKNIPCLEKYKKLGDVTCYNINFMNSTTSFEGSTYPERLLEVLKHTWKKTTDVCIMIVLLTNKLSQQNITLLIGYEHILNLRKIIESYCSV